jgi:acyl-CoA thioesterase-1
MCVKRIGWGLGHQICAVLALGALLLLSGVCSAEPSIKIVAFGTSNTFGRNVARGQDYPSKLETALKARGHNVQVINAGRNGDMIAGALARLDAAVPPDTQIAIVEIGVNDRREHNSHAYIQAGLDKIVDHLRERNVEVVVANYFDVSGGPVARGTYFVDFDVAKMPPALKIPDDPFHHLNAAGYDAVVARMLPAVEALIKRVHERERQH